MARKKESAAMRVKCVMIAIGNCLKLNWGWILAGVLLWGWGVMSLPGCFNLGNLVYSGVKVRLALMLCVLAAVIVAGLVGVRKIARRVRQGERFAKRLMRFGIITLIINGILLLLIWPGNWINDEFWILHSMTNLEYNSWQNYLTVLWYAVGTMLFHSAVGVVVMQTIFISLAFAYFLTCLDERIGGKNIIYLLFLVLLIPPIFCNDFYPLRITMYAYGELWLLCFLYRQYKVQNKIKWLTAICLGVVIFLLAYWRSEGIYYMILPLILFLFFGRGKDLGRKCLVMFGVSAVFFVGFTMMDKIMSADMYYQYKTTAFINPLSTMLTHDEVLENSKEEIAVIDEVMDVGKLREEAEYWNILVYLENTDSLYRDGYQEKIGATSRAFIKIVFKNVGYFLENRLRVFGIANGDYDDTTYWRSLNGLTSLEGEEVRSELANHVGGKPWWGELRMGILRLMRGDVWGWARVFWNVIPVAIGVLALFVILLVKRKWFAVVLVFSLMMRFVLVFLTAPASLFMYYFPTFLEGGLFVIAAIIIWFDSVSIQKKRRRLSKTDA